eukprot:808812-Amphidinium_carterae.1
MSFAVLVHLPIAFAAVSLMSVGTSCDAFNKLGASHVCARTCVAVPRSPTQQALHSRHAAAAPPPPLP